MKKVYLLCGSLFLGLVALPLRLSAEEIPEISSPRKQSRSDSPGSIGGASIPEGQAKENSASVSHVRRWKFPVHGDHRLICVKTTVRAPRPAPWFTDHPNVSLKISEDEEICEATWKTFPVDGWIEGYFTVEDPDDLRGWFVMSVYFDGELISKFMFEAK